MFLYIPVFGGIRISQGLFSRKSFRVSSSPLLFNYRTLFSSTLLTTRTSRSFFDDFCSNELTFDGASTSASSFAVSATEQFYRRASEPSLHIFCPGTLSSSLRFSPGYLSRHDQSQYLVFSASQILQFPLFNGNEKFWGHFHRDFLDPRDP